MKPGHKTACCWTEAVPCTCCLENRQRCLLDLPLLQERVVGVAPPRAPCE